MRGSDEHADSGTDGVARGVTAALALVVAAMAWTMLHREAPVAAASAEIARHRVDLNVAGIDELALLPEVGPAVAAAIVADRAEQGPFADVDALARVRGIGPATVAALAPYACVGGAPVDEAASDRR